MALSRKAVTKTEVADAPAKSASVTPLKAPADDLRARIAEAAYYRALERGFAPGSELEDWLAAEIQVLGAPRSGQAAS